MVYENDGQVVQLQVNIQVNEKDKEWLEKNSSSINEIFVKTVQKIDPETFRSEEGSEAVLVQLKDAINTQLNTSKVEAVLYKDMVIQHKVE
jgi:flagellar basal body-associated protein FliL